MTPFCSHTRRSNDAVVEGREPQMKLACHKCLQQMEQSCRIETQVFKNSPNSEKSLSRGWARGTLHGQIGMSSEERHGASPNSASFPLPQAGVTPGPPGVGDNRETQQRPYKSLSSNWPKRDKREAAGRQHSCWQGRVKPRPWGDTGGQTP